MAIKIDIPGVGEVTIEGAAQESTMQELLSAVKKSEKAKRTEEQKLAKEQAAAAKNTNALNNELDDLIESTEELTEAQEEAADETSKFGQGLKRAVTSVSANLYSFGKDLTLSAVSVSAAFAAQYDDMAKNPIRAGAEMINTTLDVLESGLKKTIDASKGVIGGLLGMIPIIGDGANKLAETAGAVGKAGVEVGATILKSGNEVFAKELIKRTEALSAFSKGGASFAGGMAEMGEIANNSGLGILDLSNVVSKARDNIYNMGLSATEGTRVLGAGLEQLAKVTNKSGTSMRNQLLALGYSYEEQGEVMAQYAAQREAEGRRGNMTATELAEGTRDYAKNLKVLSDLTGKDAKALMDKARDESLRAALQGQLSGDQLEAFKLAYAQLETLGPEYQRAFVQKMATGVVSIGEIAASTSAMAVIDQVTDAAMSGSKTILEDTNKAISSAAELSMRNKEFGVAVDSAAVHVGGFAASVASVENALFKYKLDPDAAKKSMSSAEKQMTATDGITAGFQAATDATKQFQVAMETLTGEHMKEYADMVGATIQTYTKFIKAVADFAGGKNKGDFTVLLKALGWDSDTGSMAPPTIVDRENKRRGYEVDPKTGKKRGNLSEMSSDSQSDLGFNPAFAKGGVSSGALSGYSATLHGTEAVVPLPDNRSIPVSLESSSLTAAVERNNGILNEMLDVMRKNNNLTSGILQNTY